MNETVYIYKYKIVLDLRNEIFNDCLLKIHFEIMEGSLKYFKTFNIKLLKE